MCQLRSMAGTAVYGGIIPRQKAIDLALFVASDDSSVDVRGDIAIHVLDLRSARRDALSALLV